MTDARRDFQATRRSSILQPTTSPPRPLIAVVSSRLGHDITKHRRVAAFLVRSARDVRMRNGSWIVASGCAIAPWARRAAELYQIPITWLTGKWENGNDPSGDVCFVDSTLDRDQAVIAMADRIDAVHVRSRGKIDTALHSRLKTDQNATIRVAIETETNQAAEKLVAAGAVGWYLPIDKPSTGAPVLPKKIVIDDCPSELDGEDWLVHCTRGVHGPWPDETHRQYLDTILLGWTDNVSINDRTPVDTLVRIIRSRTLVGSAIASSQEEKVVCFSARPLSDLINGRTYRSHLKRWDYEPYGILIRKSAAIKTGVRPVVYGDHKLKRRLPRAERYRYHPPGETHDWRWEQEWRLRGSMDLSQIPPDDVRVFCWDSPSHRHPLKQSPWPVLWLSNRRAKPSTMT